MTPWARNLVSSFSIKASSNSMKTNPNHGLVACMNVIEKTTNFLLNVDER
jgi:hypothetical protein